MKFTFTVEEQNAIRAWLRMRPTEAERKAYEAIAGAAFGKDATRAEILLAGLHLHAARGQAWPDTLLAVFADFVQQLSSAETVPGDEITIEATDKAVVAALQAYTVTKDSPEPVPPTQWHLTPVQLGQAITDYKLAHIDQAPAGFYFTDATLQAQVDATRGRHADDEDIQRLCDIVGMLLQERD